VIKGYSELLAQKKMPTPADETRAFDRLQSEISRMNSLISDLLLLAEMGETTVLEKESFDLGEVLQNHINDFMTISEEHPVIFEGHASLDFYGSQIHMQRLIQNALTNIRLHTPPTAPVRVSLLHKSKEIQLLIEDGGPGLTDSAYGEAVRSLQRFDRSRSRVTGGSGLGMSIISGVVSMHDGKLSLQKSELGGLAIDIRLPIVAARST
jgi:signal transduction histidine kinase